LELVDQVDLIFVPSLRRPAPAATHCAKIVGLPDLARVALPDPAALLTVDLDLQKGALALAQTVWAAGRPLTWNPVQIARAAESAWAAHLEGRKEARAVPRVEAGALTLAVVGHPYLLQDSYVNHGLQRRLEALGARLLTPDMLPPEAAERGVTQLTNGSYWAYAPSVVGAGARFLESGLVDGLVAVVAFGCAPDSGLAPVLKEAAHRAGVPMLIVTLDEHSGEAGLVTRLEAFVDMLDRKRHLSSRGLRSPA
jgi:predicted nucleotide-binding protein (sugar kinase/HSP70/actin superfamily)